MNERTSLNLSKKRLIAFGIDFYLLSYLWSLLIMIDISNEFINDYFLNIISILIIPFILLFIFIPSLTNWRTLGYIFMGLKTIDLDTYQKLTFKIYLKRLFHGILLPLMITKEQLNSLGQWLHDKKFKTIVIDNQTTLNQNKEVEILNHNLMFYNIMLIIVMIISFVCVNITFKYTFNMINNQIARIELSYELDVPLNTIHIEDDVISTSIIID